MAPRATTAGAGPLPVRPLPVPQSVWLLARPSPRPTPLPPPRVPILQATLLARPTPRMPWARSIRRSRPAASSPRPTARPTTTAALHGSSRLTVRTASTTVWCLHPEVACTCAARGLRERRSQDWAVASQAALKSLGLRPEDTKGEEQCARTDDACF